MYSWWQDHINEKSFTAARHLTRLSSTPNSCITFALGNIVWESSVANSCIRQWHETEQWANLDCPSSSCICCLHLCLASFFGSSDRVLVTLMCSCFAEFLYSYYALSIKFLRVLLNGRNCCGLVRCGFLAWDSTLSLMDSFTQEECRLTDFVSSSSQLLHGLFLQNFSSSRPNLVITFLFANFSARVICGKLLYSALARDRVANFLRSSLLIPYWLLRFVFAS